MRKAITLITIASVLVVGGYLVVFKRDVLLGWVGIATGYGPAKTPDEALDKFKKAVKARDYATASKYLGGPYGEQMQRGADAAKELGKAIDSVGYNADKRGINLTDNVKIWLISVEPFPTSFEVANLKKQGDDQATATLTQKGVYSILVELKQEGQGDDRGWKIYIPANTRVVQYQVSHLLEKHKDFARALEKVSDQIKSKEIGTKDELEQNLKSELEAAAK